MLPVSSIVHATRRVPTPLMTSLYLQPQPSPRPTRTKLSKSAITILFLSFSFTAKGLHHMKRAPIAYVSLRDSSVPLKVSNLCKETIYPGIVTQAGTGPLAGGFQLSPGSSKSQTVSADWQGRVWGRTNCSFNSAGTGASNNGGNNGGGAACGTGDCGGIIDCKATVGIFQP